jgi:hypothetical protein
MDNVLQYGSGRLQGTPHRHDVDLILFRKGDLKIAGRLGGCLLERGRPDPKVGAACLTSHVGPIG